jgi:hypothetical protein
LSAANRVSIASNTLERIQIRSDGEVIIKAPPTYINGALTVHGQFNVATLVTSSADGAGECSLQFENGNGLKGYVGYADTGTDTFFITNSQAADMKFYTGGVIFMSGTAAGSVAVGAPGTISTSATDGFPYFPMCAGVPTGTPTAIGGMAPVVIDSTNNKMYFYSGGSWRILN